MLARRQLRPAAEGAGDRPASSTATPPARLGVNPAEIDNTLYDAFGQRQVSTIYSAQNQYHVVMEVAPRYWQDPATLKDIWVSTAGGTASGTQTTNALPGTATSSSAHDRRRVGVAAASARNAATNALANTGHGTASSGAAVSTSTGDDGAAGGLHAVTASATRRWRSTIRGRSSPPRSPSTCRRASSLSDAVAALDDAMPRRSACRPASTAASPAPRRRSRQSLRSEPVLILAALVAVYIVLGMLYESFIHPITILSTLPSAGVGAVLALMAFHTEFTIIALIGVILLIGIVKKNAILMIDFAHRRRARAGPASARGDLSRPAACASARS